VAKVVGQPGVIGQVTAIQQVPDDRIIAGSDSARALGE
jgi:hypothetical protein